jgi:hypothetical protein
MTTVPELLEGGRHLPCLDDRLRAIGSFPLLRLSRDLPAELARCG